MAKMDVDPQAIISKLRTALEHANFQTVLLQAALEEQEKVLEGYREKEKMETLLGESSASVSSDKD